MASTILKKGSSGLLVKTLQANLIKLGYSCGSAGADGDFGTNTYNAVKQFQSDHGLEVDGEAGPLTLAAIAKALVNKTTTNTTQTTTNTTTTTTTLQKGSTGAVVKVLQQNLIKLGYSCGSAGADGDFGSATYSAVSQFQAEHGLTATGIADANTLAAIQTALKESTTVVDDSTTTTDTIPAGGCTAARLVAIARNEIGYHEKLTNSQLDSKSANSGSGNWTKYARDLAAAGYYGGHNKNGYAWCDVFVDWCFYQLAGQDASKAQAVQCQTGTGGAVCDYSLEYFKKQNRLRTTPVVGAQIFFYGTNGIAHTGIVESFTASTVLTIEGNSSDQVIRRSYTRSNKAIAGYGIPKFEDESSVTVDETSESNTYVITASSLYVRTGPSKDTEATGTFLHKGETYEISEINGRYGKLANGMGWICMDWAEKV